MSLKKFKRWSRNEDDRIIISNDLLNFIKLILFSIEKTSSHIDKSLTGLFVDIFCDFIGLVDEKLLIFDWSWEHFFFKNTLSPWCDGIWLLLGFKRCLWTSYVQNEDLKGIHLNQKWLIFLSYEIISSGILEVSSCHSSLTFAAMHFLNLKTETCFRLLLFNYSTVCTYIFDTVINHFPETRF